METVGSLKITPVDASFGAVVTGVSLAEIDAASLAVIYEAWLEYALLIFPGQHLNDDQQIAFGRRLSNLEFQLTRLTNIDSDGRVRQPDEAAERSLAGNRYWHADSTFYPVQAKGAVFTGRIVTSKGGETEWADMRAGYDALDDETRARVNELSAYHSLYYSQARNGYVPDPDNGLPGDIMMYLKKMPLRPLVKVHPETGRRSLNIGRHAFGVVGLEPADSEKFLDDLLEVACQRPRTWAHSWTAGDCVLWDNRCLLHRVRPWDPSEPRDMRHTRLGGHPLTEYAPVRDVDLTPYLLASVPAPVRVTELKASPSA